MITRIVDEVKSRWQARLFILGILLFVASFFFTAFEEAKGYDLALMMVTGIYDNLIKGDFIGVLLLCFYNGANLFALLSIVLYFTKFRKKVYLLFCLTGIASAAYWMIINDSDISLNKLTIGYWSWLLGQLIIQGLFISKLFNKEFSQQPSTLSD